MRIFRVGLVALLVALLSSPVLGQASRTVTRTFDLARAGTVALDTYKGRVDVRTADTQTARVEVRIEGDDPAAVDQTRIRFEASPDRLEIDTDYDEIEGARSFFGLFQWRSVDRPATYYTLEIPRTAALNVETYSAATVVAGPVGAIEFDAYSADLTVDRVGEAFRASTYSGDVRVRRAEGSVSMDTYSGDLRADSLAGPTAFTSYSGSATLSFAALPDDCRFESFSGDVTLRLPRRAGAIVETTRDALDAEVPSRIEPIGDGRIRATIGEGGPTLTFDTFGGTLTLRRR
jgi:hypothetical protein